MFDRPIRYIELENILQCCWQWLQASPRINDNTNMALQCKLFIISHHIFSVCLNTTDHHKLAEITEFVTVRSRLGLGLKVVSSAGLRGGAEDAAASGPFVK